VNRWPTEETVLGLFFDVENPMKVGETDPKRAPGNRWAGRAPGPPTSALDRLARRCSGSIGFGRWSGNLDPVIRSGSGGA
jgi:hypothetical protein